MNWEERLESIPGFMWDVREQAYQRRLEVVNVFYLQHHHIPLGRGRICNVARGLCKALRAGKISEGLRQQYSSIVSALLVTHVETREAKWGTLYSSAVAHMSDPYWWRRQLPARSLARLTLLSRLKYPGARDRQRQLAALGAPKPRSLAYSFNASFDSAVAEYKEYFEQNGFRPPATWRRGWIKQAKKLMPTAPKTQKTILLNLLCADGAAARRAACAWGRHVSSLLALLGSGGLLRVSRSDWYMRMYVAARTGRLSAAQKEDAENIRVGMAKRESRAKKAQYRAQHPHSKSKTKP